MSIPVFFVHGVATHQSADFEANVRRLNQQVGGQFEYVPVFWGDLAGRSEFIADALPVIQEAAERAADAVRSLEGTPSVDPAVIRALLGDLDAVAQREVRSETAAADIIADHATAAPAGAGTVRALGPQDELRQAVRNEVASTRFLQHVQDPETLAAAGRLIASAAAPELSAEATNTRTATRGFLPPGALGGLQEKVKAVVAQVDEFLGTAVGHALGKANQNLRANIANPFVNFFGDIFVYQRNRAAIQKRIWDTISRHSPGAGTKEQPINLVAHSMGSVICFDMALHGTASGQPLPAATGQHGPLWVKSYVTFGSQPALFHVIDRRQEIDVYKHGEPVVLPPTIARWTSLWDSMDFLAFTAGVIFKLADGTSPEDIPVYDKLSLLVAEKGWTHSIYWQTPQLLEVMKNVFE